uniref:Major tail protein n=1 Tax=Siphoviridae sp. ctpbb7 TaxID=2826465 RepID=A0A8S5N0H5_9CAUD|nr:MAG TPA: major tail protein [Siphoviridae sp. ctpbb7]
MPGKTPGRLGNSRKERKMTSNVFSEFEIIEQHIKIAGNESFENMNCVGSSEEELGVKTITKKCRGKVAKKRTRGTGDGTLKQSLHVPRSVYNEIYNMVRKELAKGVYAYGENSKHPEFSLTQKVLDEDGNIKFKAYPRCILSSGPSRKIENGAEEVAELEMTIDLMPDENGECMYEALESELESEEIKQQWLTNFSLELVKAV